MKILSGLLLGIAFGSIFPMAQGQNGFNNQLYSTAELTQFEKTTLSNDVRSFVAALDQASKLVHVEVFGQSLEKQDLQLVVLADPPVRSPEEAQKSGKPVIYVQGNIHAGEVEGKEASITLMREIALGPKRYLLDNLIILFCPNFNPDGNDKLSDNNRRNQDGSPKLTGTRSTAEGFDLNREGLKLEALEAKALVKNVLNKWDPHVLIDLHTDNGSWHGYTVSYAPAFHSIGEIGPTLFTKNQIFPWIREDVDSRTGIQMWWHGYLRTGRGGPASFAGYSHLPHYFTNYMGLRNRIGILSETFAHQLFEKRYWGTYYLVESILRFCNDNPDELLQVIRDADANTLKTIAENDGSLERGVRFGRTQDADTVEILVRETEYYENADGRRRIRGTGKIYWEDSVLHYNAFEPTKTSTVPKAYYFPKELKSIADKLQEHGIEVKTLDKNVRVQGSLFTVEEIKKSERSRYKGHNPVSLEGSFIAGKKRFKKGDYCVPMNQKLAWVIFYLLEPESDDGLVYWNYFDAHLKTGEVFPVFKAFN